MTPDLQTSDLDNALSLEPARYRLPNIAWLFIRPASVLLHDIRHPTYFSDRSGVYSEKVHTHHPESIGGT